MFILAKLRENNFNYLSHYVEILKLLSMQSENCIYFKIISLETNNLIVWFFLRGEVPEPFS